MHLLADIPLRFEPSPLLLPLAAAAAVAAALTIDAMTWLFAGARRGRTALVVLGAGLLAATAAAAAGTFLAPVAVGVPVLCAAALWMAVRGYWRTTAPQRRWIKAALLALRVATVLLLLAFLARPILKFTHVEHERATVILLVDASRSMGVKDVPVPGPAGMVLRAQAAADALAAAADGYQAMADRYDVRAYRFCAAGGAGRGRSVLTDVSAARFAPIADGASTDLGAAMAEAIDRHLAGKLAAVFILTDGANTLTLGSTPAEAARVLAARGVPLVLAPFGSPDPPAGLRDIVIRNLEVAPKVNAFNTTPVKAQLDLIGLADRDVTVELLMDDKPIPGQQRVRVAAREQQTVNADFDVTFAEPGFHKLSVVAHPPPGAALSSENNRMSAYVQVVDEGVRVLYVGGRFRYENKYLAMSLAADPDIRFQRRILFKPPGQGDEPLPQTPQQWSRYHVLIFGDVPREQLTDEQLAAIREAVDRVGSGFLMIGGYRSFGDGGYAGTPIADLLPVEIHDRDGQIDRPLKVRPTDEPLAERLLLIVPSDGKPPEQIARENADAWALLPPVAGASRVGALKPAATAVAVAEDDTPILAVGAYGKGRTAALTCDTTWQWRFNPAEIDTRESHVRFWRQLVLHLANRKPSCWIAADRSRYQLPLVLAGKQTVALTAGVTDADGKPISDAQLDCRVARVNPPAQGAPRSILMAFDEGSGLFQPAGGQLIADEDGDYEVTLGARAGGADLGASSTRFLVSSPDVELANPLADVQGLKQLALEAGPLGSVISPDALGEAFKKLDEANITRQHLRTEIVDVADLFRWPLFAAVLTLTAVEWAVRKKKGLV